LNNLVEEGLLVKHGQIGRLWTRTQKAEELQPARRIAERIAGGLAECEQHGDLASSWYGYVDLEDVRALVAAVLGGPFPQDRMEP
jgi:(2Fe-2S) ferredoxin